MVHPGVRVFRLCPLTAVWMRFLLFQRLLDLLICCFRHTSDGLTVSLLCSCCCFRSLLTFSLLVLQLPSMALLRDLLLFYCLVWRTTGQLDVVVGPEENAELQCRSPAEGKISVLKWSRPNRNSDGYVYFYRNNRCLHNYQHPRFQGRVELKRPDMKDGDATLILKNVTEQDAGIYECYTSVKNPGRSKRSSVETSQFINLTVTGETRQTAEKLEFIVEEPEGNPEDAVTVGTSVPLAVVVGVAAVCVLGFVGRWTVKSRKQLRAKNHSDAEEESMFPGKNINNQGLT